MAFHVICLMFVGLVWYSIYQQYQRQELERELRFLKVEPPKPETGTPITPYDKNGRRIFL